jgi:hypothetical protein
MSPSHWIVVEDRRQGPDRLGPGEVVTTATYRKLCVNRGLHFLPCVADLVNAGAFSGYFRREYGTGVPMPEALPASVCRMAVQLNSVPSDLNWMARVTTILGGHEGFTGRLSIVGDTSQAIMGAPLSTTSESTFNFAKLTEDEYEDGGWVIGGTAKTSPQSAGVFGLALYGAARGFRVEWVAVTQSYD